MDTGAGTAILIEPIGVISSPFGEKFGTPRQSGLVEEAVGELKMLAPFDDPAMLEGLDGFSHVWLTFRFDRCVAQGWRARVRPPRLGGNTEVGVWASRSPFRPNHLGLSVVRLIAVVNEPFVGLRVAGLDLVDKTPVIDIKPYLPYADCVAGARGGFADARPEPELAVDFAPGVERRLAALRDGGELRRLIIGVIGLDPRPAYRRGPEPQRHYGMRLADHEVGWRVVGRRAEVTDFAPLDRR
jgi:tRNA-Thr(GGU) m(6)t(6)A37 methyltransferase TsaA